jgi:hypothetical protein
VANTWNLDETERPSPGLRFLQNFGTQDVGGHQVRCELHAFHVETEHCPQRFNQPSFAQTRYPDQQRMAARHQCNKRLIYDRLLAENDARDAFADSRQPVSQGLDLGDQAFLGPAFDGCRFAGIHAWSP